MNQLKESNRTKHLLYAIPIGFIFTILAVLGCAFGMEFKDNNGEGNFDLLDTSSYYSTSVTLMKIRKQL